MISAIIQARVGSTRLPNKIFADISGQPLLWHVINRLRKSKYLDSIIIATTVNVKDDEIEKWALDNKVLCFRGSEANVLQRYYEAAKYFDVEVIVRITADDPFKDYKIMDQVIDKFKMEGADFACNNNPPSFPEGLDIEVFSFDAIEQANIKALTDIEKEHVTQHFYKNPDKFKISTISHEMDLSYLRWTIDEELDLKMARNVYDKIYGKKTLFLMDDILELIRQNPEIALINAKVNRSIMYKK
jgi:spore coat polysaccharide biosynthesis protein SpsF